MDKFQEEDDNENDRDWVLGRQKQATMSANAMVALVMPANLMPALTNFLKLMRRALSSGGVHERT